MRYFGIFRFLVLGIGVRAGFGLPVTDRDMA
jgi:hypothetical protein